VTVLVGSSPGAAPPAPVRLDALGDPLPDGAVARLGSARFRCGCMEPHDLALTADGKLAAALEDDGSTRIALIDPVTGRRLRSFAADGARTIAFAGNKELICADEKSTMRVYDVAQGKQVRKFEVEAAYPFLDSLSSDGRFLATSTKPDNGK